MEIWFRFSDINKLVELLRHVMNLCLTLLENAKQFSKVPFYILTSDIGEFPLLHIL